MKILQVGSSLHGWGGIERYIVSLSEGLEARGHDVWVTCPPDSRLSARVRQPIALGSKAKRNPLLFLRYRRLLQSLRPDVIQTHFSPDFAMPALAAQSLGIPAVLTRHLAVPWSPRKARVTIRPYRSVICVSDAVRRALLPVVPADKLHVVYAGAKPVAVPLAARSGAFTVGSFNRLVAEKGVDLLVEAARLCPEIRFEIYGNGPERASLEAKAPANVSFHGRIEDVTLAMATCDAIALPSRWAEAFPIAALEAMSLGVPVVATRVGGMPEQIVDGETGLLVEPESPQALAEAFRTLAARSDRGSSLGAGGQVRQREQFTIENFAHATEKILALYRYPS